MIKWELISDEKARMIWDRALARFDDCSPFQTYAWGEYRRALGWTPFRWAAFDESNEVVAMLQGCVRRYWLGIGLLWAEGGPIGDISACDDRLQETIEQTTRLRRIYCRVRCDRPRKIDDVLKMSAQGWSLPWSPLTSSYTMTADLTRTEEELLNRCERNWRRNLKRSGECNLEVRQWLNPTAEEIVSVYQSMQQVKGIDQQHSREEIEQMLAKINQLIVFRCEDHTGQLLSFLACVRVGHSACSVLSATSARGRSMHSSYAILWALLQHCRSIGVTKYDLAGIDPIRNPGVYRFKRASGATPLELLGEWDWASRPWLRWVGNWAIAQRARVRQAETILNKTTPTKSVEILARTPPVNSAQIQFRES